MQSTRMLFSILIHFTSQEVNFFSNDFVDIYFTCTKYAARIDVKTRYLAHECHIEVKFFARLSSDWTYKLYITAEKLRLIFHDRDTST